MYYFMDSGPKFTGLVWLNAEKIARDHMSFRFLISCSLPEIFVIKVGSCVKSVQILHVFGSPKFFRGGPPEFLDLDYLFRVDSDDVVKFRGDRPRELGDPVSD